MGSPVGDEHRHVYGDARFQHRRHRAADHSEEFAGQSGGRRLDYHRLQADDYDSFNPVWTAGGPVWPGQTL